MRVSVHVCSRDRHSELALLLQSLRTQTFQDWDLVLLDDASGTPIANNYFVSSLINRLQLEGHSVKLMRNERSSGVCAARNKLIDEDVFGNELVCRLDDDVILENDYLSLLVAGITEYNYDLVSGVTPLLAYPEHVRETKRVVPIINEHVINENGELVTAKDECGYCYDSTEYVDTHQFRSNALYKRAITDSGVRYPDYLTKVGFREEGFFSFSALMKGYSLGVCTGAVAWHLQTPSGGCRTGSYPQDVALDDKLFRSWISSNAAKLREVLV